jgi:hypothetical protein
MARPSVHPSGPQALRWRPQRAIGRVAGAAVLALLLAQWAALVHAIEHAPQHATQAVAHATDHDHDDAAQDHWGHDADTPVCDLVDHLLLGDGATRDAPAGSASAPAALPPPTPQHASVDSAVWPAYEARGPPRA